MYSQLRTRYGKMSMCTVSLEPDMANINVYSQLRTRYGKMSMCIVSLEPDMVKYQCVQSA